MTVPFQVNPADGATLAHGVGTGPTVYTTVLGITSLDGVMPTADTIETTRLVNTGFKTFRLGLLEGNELTIEFEADAKCDGQSFLWTLFYGQTQAPTGEQWQITLNDAHVSSPTANICTFTGIITSLGIKTLEAGSNEMGELKIKVNSLPVWT